MTPLFRKLLGLNWPLVLTMYGLLVFGVFSIESAARHLPGGGALYAEKQKLSILIGSVIYFGTALIDYRWYRWLGLPIWIAGLGLMSISTGVGQVKLGSSFMFQPAQIVLAGGLLLTGCLLQDLPRLGRLIPKVGWLLDEPFLKIAIVGVISGVSFLVVMAKGDMGSAIVWIPLAAVTLLIAGIPFRYLTALSLVGAALLPVAFYVILPAVSERGPERMDTYWRMLHGKEVDVLDEGYAAHRVSVAVGKAGWLGAGWNADANRNSLHAKGFIPQETAHNDYIFAVIAEEQGFRGSLLLLTSFALLLVLCLFIGAYARDPMGRLLVGGTVAIFFAHIFENIGMCVLLMPITGIPLPMISYSGTFVVICMFLLGLVQSVWVHRDAVRVVEEDVKETQPKPSVRSTRLSHQPH